MALDDSELEEFKSEARDLIEEAERCLLEVEQGQEFRPRYDAVFRCFHSLKGAAGMLELEALRNHMHKLEDMFAGFKDLSNLSQTEITFFLDGIDGAKKIISGDVSDFKFELPKEKSAVTSAAISQPSVKVDVFVIDDEEDLVEILQTYMKKAGLSSKGFTDPLKAIVELEKNPPSLVISDLKMPGLDGLGVLKQVKDLYPEMPVIFISAQLSKEALLEAIGLGVSAVLEKPFRETTVISQVTQTLTQAELSSLLNRTMEVLMFQMPDLEQYLLKNNKQEILKMLKSDIAQLLQKRRQIRENSKRLKR